MSGAEEYVTRGVMGISGGAIVEASLALAFGGWERIIVLTLELAPIGHGLRDGLPSQR